MRLALEPHVLDRILFWGMGRKAQTGNFPVGRGQGGILLGQKLLHFLPPVVAGSIPELD